MNIVFLVIFYQTDTSLVKPNNLEKNSFTKSSKKFKINRLENIKKDFITCRLKYKIDADCVIDRPYSSNPTTFIIPNCHVINQPERKNRDL